MQDENKLIELPPDFKIECKDILGGEWDKFVEALSSESSISIRINPNKINNISDLDAIVGSVDVNNKNVPWCENGKYLLNRPQFTLDPMFHSGAYYVQEASSMFINQALLQYVAKDSLVLDMCAAPGGKSSLVSGYLNEDGMLVSNEYLSQRAHVLVENMTKWGAPNGIVTNNSPVHFENFKNYFDVVLVDAPCSGEGMFRKDINAISEWSLINVDKCFARQREILNSAWIALKPGGILIYSTCTFNKKENEEQISWFIETYNADYLRLKIDKSWGIKESDYGYRFFPHKTRGEGLFLSVLRKRDADFSIYKYKMPKKLPEKNDQLLYWINNKDEYTTIFHNGIFYAVQKKRYALIVQMIDKLNVMTFGIPLAEIKGKSVIPQSGLALSIKYNRESFPEIKLSYKQAIAFLRTEAIILENIQKGYLLMSYKNLPLGWVKNIGNRCNNLYPEHWRIRKNI